MRHRTVDERVDVIRRYRLSGRSLAAFAAGEGIAANSLRRWLDRYEAPRVAPVASFVPVVVRPSSRSGRLSATSSFALPTARGSGVALDVGGVEVVLHQDFDRTVLGAVIEVLQGLAERRR